MPDSQYPLLPPCPSRMPGSPQPLPRTGRLWLLALLSASLLLCRPSLSARSTEAKAQFTEQAVQVRLGRMQLWLELAQSPTERMRGLMYRELPLNDQGMLFTQERPAYQSFWMKNTWSDLDIAFFDREGRICSIHTMKAHDLTPVASACSGRLALEMAPGWFARRKIRVGTSLEMIKKVPLSSLPVKTWVGKGRQE
jgi:uncharacterized membrane protein (UPF0127 family)